MRQLKMDLLQQQDEPSPITLDEQTRQVVIGLLAEAMVAVVVRQASDTTGGDDEPDRL